MTATARTAHRPLGLPHFPTDLTGPGHATYAVVTVPHGALRPSGVVKREGADDLTHLALSIYTNTVYGADGAVSRSGIQTPLIARPGQPGDIAVGQRRWLAVGLLIAGLDYEAGGLTRRCQVAADYPVPVQFRDLSDEQMVEVALTDAAHTRPLTELDQADLCVTLHRAGFSYDEIARKCSLSYATVERRITLGYHLGEEGRELLRSGVITLRSAQVLCRVGDDLRHTLIRAARDGMDTRGLVGLAERGDVRPEYALFDVPGSGLGTVQTLFGGEAGGFSDKRAALAHQLAAVHDRAQAWRAQHGTWAEVRATETDPALLPDDLTTEAGDAPQGCAFVMHSVTGQVCEHRDVRRKADLPLPPPAAPAPALPAAPDRERNRLSGVKPWVIQAAADRKAAALADALMAHPRAGLVNAVMQSLQRGGRLQVGGMTSAQKRGSRQVQAYASVLAAQHPALFVSFTPGLLQLRREVSEPEAFRALLSWAEGDLIRLLTFCTCASAFEGSGAYQREVARTVGADALIEDRFELSDELLEAHTRSGLEDLIASMPEPLRPIVTDTERRAEIRGLIKERAGHLKAARWVPPYARL